MILNIYITIGIIVWVISFIFIGKLASELLKEEGDLDGLDVLFLFLISLYTSFIIAMFWFVIIPLLIVCYLIRKLYIFLLTKGHLDWLIKA